MESAGCRHKGRQAEAISPARESPALAVVPPEGAHQPAKDKENPQIPKFTIDLSLPPESRYDHIAPHFRERVEDADLLGMFDDLLYALTGPILSKGLGVVARLALHRLYSAEETAELSGISKAIGVPMYFLVAFNVLLDLLLGCTSGGVCVLDPKKSTPPAKSHILHFRTLDWGMDELRRIVVELDFVRFSGGPIVATAVTYLGYIGVLTGVREGLSMSLNFRPYHDRSTWRSRAAFRYHQALVVLGCRQSISSVLRGLLLDPRPAETLEGGGNEKTEAKAGRVKASQAKEEEKGVTVEEFQAILDHLSRSPSTAAYLILCMPQRVCIVEKDHRKASVRESETFLTAYNHDASDENNPSHMSAAAEDLDSDGDVTGMADILKYSLARKTHLEEMWQKRVRACCRRHGERGQAVTTKDVLRLVKDPEISNDETHFAVVMDPQAGKVIWRRLYEYDQDDSELVSM
ncbi:Fc.00g104700.m01.CDS01 [Cosmosporella sp. VM-42]